MKLDAKNVSVSIAGTTIVRNLSIEVPDLKFSALLGTNGSGKTTLLRSIYRTQKNGQRHRSSGRQGHHTFFRQKAGAEHGGDGPIQPDQF